MPTSKQPRDTGSNSPRAAKKPKVESTEAESDSKATVLVGTVTTFQPKRGYGFISQDAGGPDVFVHQSQIVAVDEGYRALKVGQKVEYTAVEEGGRWKATKVTGIGGVPLETQGKNKKAATGKGAKAAAVEVKVSGAELQAKVQTQIEYYLGDKNLTRDLWMRALIIASGAVSVSNLLKCNKLKALTTDLAVIQASVEASPVLHMTTLPEEGKDGATEPAVARGANADSVPALPEYTPPSVLLLTGLAEGSTVTWKDVRAGFLSNYAAPIFVYLTAQTPFIVINGEHKAAIPKVLEGGIKNIDGAAICTVSEPTATQGEELLNQHYAALAKQSSSTRKKKGEKRKAPAAKAAPREGPVSVGPEEFESEQDVYDKVKAIMKQYKNSAPLLGEDKKFMMNLLKAHPRADDKLKGARGVIVKDNDRFDGSSRCFYVVNKDGVEEDISYVKCIRNL